MKVAEITVEAIQKLATGNEGLSKYRAGPALVSLFNKFGFNDVYGQGFPSRWAYAENKIRQLNGTIRLPKLIEAILDPREFLGTDLSQEAACAFLNERLRYDGFTVALVDTMPRVKSTKQSAVEFERKPAPAPAKEDRFIDEQLLKCDEKIKSGDFDGAITNARSMLEAYLLELEGRFDNSAKDYDGDLPRLYKRVQIRLNLDPSRKDLDDIHRQTLTGLVSVISGLSGFSNKMGDRHARKYRPAERHALLVVNCAKTLATFLQATLAVRSPEESD